MRAVLLGLLAVLAMGAAPAPRQVSLIGLSPEAVRARLGGAGGPYVPAALIGLSPRGRLAVVDGAALSPGSTGRVFVFREGRLTGVYVRRPSPTPPSNPRLSAKAAQKRLLKMPVDNPLVDRPGDLPLESDVDAFVSRLLPAASASSAPPPATASAPVRPRNPVVDLTRFPFAVLAPEIAAQRIKVQQAGFAVMTALQLGQVLPGGPDAFVRAHPGSRVYWGRGRRYAIVSLDLGVAPGAALTARHVAGLVGVRDGRVEWIGRSDSGRVIGLGEAMCLDDKNRHAPVRRGCGSTGDFSP